MIADVPLGAFLSGGLDSSIIVSHLAEEASPAPQTFSIGYKDHPQYDESAYAQRVAGEFGTLKVEITNVPTDNPRTGKLTAMSMVRAVADALDPVRIGN